MTLNEGNPEKKHRKHAKLLKPAIGNYGRNEWAIVGGPCVVIKLLADDVITALGSTYRCAYVDTSHNDDLTLLPGRLAAGAVVDYTNQLNYQQFNFQNPLMPYQLKQQFANADMVLVNGNHQQAKAQIVIIDINKRASLLKRLDQLTNVELFLLADNSDDLFDFIRETIPDWQQIPVYKLADKEKIVAFFDTRLKQAKPVLNGLVLAGGKSQRMGFDKGEINLYGEPQRYHMADMLKPFCNEVYISYAADQLPQNHSPYPALVDTFTGLGPYGAILSAFREQPDSAWLVIACDLPLMDEGTLRNLVAWRNSSSVATAYHSPVTDFPEPLIAIWEPKSYPILLSFLAQGYSCPRKVLINTDITLLNAPQPEALTNVNTPEELETVRKIIQQKLAATNEGS
ncbi:NTP transferase domain-containing protein [Mucilaginibacter dorajii]|uniref:Probable molybdenum cofactor guanylyltransferase n=1 Tax=Mucilaginibacter dorajii TaxID=692994 RepID=A0ABP7QN44_9SPHI|nr:NTP transferase domain-containing protein [Mucilaginibacter dorajii]MCS3735859.1 molybdopterin-guanine dinucleotide biosynthesis protein A [Mucilaginibacter dorajii]